MKFRSEYFVMRNFLIIWKISTRNKKKNDDLFAIFVQYFFNSKTFLLQKSRIFHDFSATFSDSDSEVSKNAIDHKSNII